MAYTQKDLDALRKAMSSGVLRTKFGEREIVYRSLDEMRQQERVMMRELGQTPTTRTYPSYGSGL